MTETPIGSSSNTVSLLVTVGLAGLVGIGAFVFYRQATIAKGQAARAVAQQQAAAEELAKEKQRLEQTLQPFSEVHFHLAYFKHVTGVSILSEHELAVITPSFAEDQDMQKLVAQIAADKERVAQHFDPESLVQDDYHTLLQSACNQIRAFEKHTAQLEDRFKETQRKLDEAESALSRRSP